jgi:hypothetical protein
MFTYAFRWAVENNTQPTQYPNCVRVKVKTPNVNTRHLMQSLIRTASSHLSCWLYLSVIRSSNYFFPMNFSKVKSSPISFNGEEKCFLLMSRSVHELNLIAECIDKESPHQFRQMNENIFHEYTL